MCCPFLCRSVVHLSLIHIFAGKAVFGEKAWALGAVHVVPNAIEVDKFSYNDQMRAQMRQKLELGNCLTVGHVGRFNEMKNHLFLLEVFAQIKKLSLIHIYRPWTGFGTALSEGVKGVRSVFPQAQILITSPNYASYFPVPVKNMGEKALYNYASIACDVAVGQGTLCVDTYDNLGVDAYNADEYLEDGIHLNEKGRSLYAKTIASCLLYGTAGQISGNNIASFN